ncbi:MAG: hypothetical protein ABI697_09870 [Devosia sp.]
MRVWRIIGVLVLLIAGQAAAQDVTQDAAPEPAPLPQFHAPLTNGGTLDPSANDAAAAPSDPTPVAADDVPETPATQAIAAVTAEPQPVTLTALISDGGSPIAAGLVWRIFSARPDPAGRMQLAAKSDNPIARITLAPGNYVVHVAYGKAQADDTLTVKPGENDKSIVLEAGGLRLNAAITGDVPIPINLLRFDIFTPGQSDTDRALIAQNLGANDIVTLNAGTYHVVSYFGEVNALVRADLRVETGKLTDVTLYHRAAQVSFRLVSEAGGEAIADVDWTVKTADGKQVFTNTGTFPATVLQEGDYTVFAKRGDKVYNREFQVQPGQPREVEVLTAVY